MTLPRRFGAPDQVCRQYSASPGMLQWSNIVTVLAVTFFALFCRLRWIIGPNMTCLAQERTTSEPPGVRCAHSRGTDCCLDFAHPGCANNWEYSVECRWLPGVYAPLLSCVPMQKATHASKRKEDAWESALRGKHHVNEPHNELALQY